MDNRVLSIRVKTSANEREELNELILQKGCSMSDLIREALREYYSLDGFEPSYSTTASKSYTSKWGLY